jgi:hypothetical protein
LAETFSGGFEPMTTITTNFAKTKAADLVADLTAGSALLVPLTQNGEQFLAAAQGTRIFGAVFCKRSTAELLIVRAAQDGVAVRIASDSREQMHSRH